METVIQKLAEQSPTIGVMIVMFYYQRQDHAAQIERMCLEKADLLAKYVENTKVIQEMRGAIDRFTERLENLKHR
ncbi:hypothetical protein [Fibrella aquatilis]|uniref:Uncharacterized protein n=1 Tax=Fibrella aquatilis TaxID=2817059 RepID=A0A939GA34_9BACT|nr:hypothetical protein [Fibrella aquatilis]MBO0934606.1 hypothetical protein [Fibrella aquatilis]